MRLRTVLLASLTLAYPLLIYLGLTRFEPRWLALVLAGMAVVRAFGARDRLWLGIAALALALAALTWIGNLAMPLKLYPVLVNTALLLVFTASLLRPPSMIERLARLREPNLPPSGVAYTRRVTQIWCGFFVVNGSIALITALWASDAVWALYNGLIAYGLMGVLFAGEWLVRRRMRGSLAHG